MEYLTSDGLDGTTVEFNGTAITRNVNALGGLNTFNIESTGAGGPYNLVGDTGISSFSFAGSSMLLGTVNGGGLSSLNYAGYGSGVSVNLGNGTNGTGTGVSGAIQGINAVIGSPFDDSLNAGTVANVSLTGGAGNNMLTGTASGGTVVNETAGDVMLTNTSLTAPGIDDTLSGITIAQLNDAVGKSTFTVSGWSGTGSLAAPADHPDTVVASKKANFTLSDSSLTSSDGMSMDLSGITSAGLTATVANKTFTVSGWTGAGTLTSPETQNTGTGATTSGGTVTATEGGSFALGNTSLSSSAGLELALVGFIRANLTDSETGGNRFNITGWTGTASLVGPGDTLVDAVAANTTLTNTSLAVTGLPKVTLSGFTAANLTDSSTGGITFTVSGWTRSGSLTDADSGGSSDAVTSAKGAGYTLSDTALTSTDGMSLGLSGLASANLTDTSGGNTFDVSGWDQLADLVDSASTVDTINATKSANFTLTNTSLSSTDGMFADMRGIRTANLTSAFSNASFTVSSWTGSGSLTSGNAAGGSDNLRDQGLTATKNASFTLSDTSLVTTDGMSMSLSGITMAFLTATSSNKSFTVSGWTGKALLTGGGTTGSGSANSGSRSGTVIAVGDGPFTLSTIRLTAANGMDVELEDITTADLTDTGAGGDTISIAGWNGAAALVGPGDTLVDTVTGNTTLTNTSLAVTGLPKVTLSGFTAANLAVTAATGQTVVDASAFSAGPTNVTVSGSATVIVFGGTAGNDALAIAAGATGNDVLIGNGPFDRLTDNGSGFDILIGAGAGGDTITGNGTDILVSGATKYDKNTSANLAALDAILAEWSSTDNYTLKISRITSGVGAATGAFALNSKSITPDTNANTLSDGAMPVANVDWFLTTNQDTVENEAGETVTII